MKGNIKLRVKMESSENFNNLTKFLILCFIVLCTSNRLGNNKRGETVRRTCKEADIQGRFTNHSLRATTATRGLQEGIAGKFVMARTGHRDIGPCKNIKGLIFPLS